MRFCTSCGNMLYLRVQGQVLSYVCAQCPAAAEERVEPIVLHTRKRTTEQRYHHALHPHTKYDPTLPRLHDMPCPQPSCPSHQHVIKNVRDGKDGSEESEGKEEKEEKEEKGGSEVLYIRYDDKRLKYLYLCVHCDATWTTS